MVKECIYPASLLVDDAGKVARVVRKRSLRFLGESLDTAERRVLVEI